MQSEPKPTAMKSSLKKSQSPLTAEKSTTKPTVTFARVFKYKGKKIIPTSESIDSNSAKLRSFANDEEFFCLVQRNGAELFGNEALFVSFKNKEDHFLPEHFLLDLAVPEKPLCYIAHISRARRGFNDFHLRLLLHFGFLKRSDCRNVIVPILAKLIAKNETATAAIQNALKQIGEKVPKGKRPLYEAIGGYVIRALIEAPRLMLITDGSRPETPLLSAVYAAWDNLRIVYVEKVEVNNELYCAIRPALSSFREQPKTRKEKQAFTETNHLERTTDELRFVFETIKKEVLDVDSGIQFNPQRYYISMRKNKNLAFFGIKRKKISIVVMLPEETVRKQIKHNAVISLKESVQKFYNGACCTIMIENSAHLSEITGLLKKMVSEA